MIRADAPRANREGARRRARLLLGSTLILAAAGAANAQNIIVSPGGPIRSVQEAVRLVPAGGRITIRPGHYREATIVIDKPVEIIGDGFPILDGEGERQIMTILADDVTVRGLRLHNVGMSYLEDQAAIMVDGARGCRIEDNRLDNTHFGIYLAAASDCRITGNLIIGRARTETSSGNGIHLWNTRRVVIEDNQVRGHRDGIYFEFVEDGDIRRNLSEGNLRYGLHFMFSNRCRYSTNIFRRNGAGVAVMYTAQVRMEGNRFEENWGQAAFGLLLKDIDDSEVYGNTFRSNTVGIFMDGSNRVRIEGNNLRENGWAVRILANSVDNLITHNNFTGNSFDVTTNSRQNYSVLLENYWDQYRGYDLDRDGFGDVPYYPVRLFSLLAEQTRPLLILLRSPFVGLLDAAERVLPVLTPKALADERPALRPFR